MPFLGIILRKGVSCFNRGVCFSDGGGGFIFKLEGGGTPWGALLLVGGEGFKKNCKIGGECPTMPPTTGNPSVSILLS